jgi:STE24 endopeptidase
MNIWLFTTLLILITSYLIETIASFLNIKAMSIDIPPDFKDIYNQQEYRDSQNYLRTTSKFSILQNSFNLMTIILFLLLGGFNQVDLWARGFGFGSILTGLIYISTLFFFTSVINLPFSIYSTFYIDEKFGFNRTTVATFILDTIKATILTVLIGIPLLTLILWFLLKTGTYSWLYCWGGVFIFSLIVQLLAPVLILPLFNTFTPLEQGKLKEAIAQYCQFENFQLRGVFTMDGSRRSSKLNAFFTGFGRFRKIVLFDTLVQKLTVDEIIAILAHEMGHFKLNHIKKMLLFFGIQTGIMFFILSIFLENHELVSALGIENFSVYCSIVFFSFMYSPINMFLSTVLNFLSRKHEFEADAYSVRTTGMAAMLISALKNLSKNNLGNLSPHPFYVLLKYTHPPLSTRIEHIKNVS